MKKITVGFLRMVLRQYDNEEISFSKMVEFLNEEANSDNSALKFIKQLRLGGRIVSSGSLSNESISQAQACGRFFVDNDSFGYVYFPKKEDVKASDSSNSEHLLNIPDVSGSFSLDFIKWYSGMEEQKILKAYERYKIESGNDR